MNCEDVRRLVDASIDGELDVVREIEFEAHLAGCGACTKVVEARRATRAAIERSGLYFRPPVGLEQRVRQTIANSRARGTVSSRRWVPTAVLSWVGRPLAVAAAALVVFAAAAGTWMVFSRPSPGTTLAQEVVTAHIRAMLPGHLVDVPTSDQHTVKPWFAGRVDFSPPVTDLSAQGYPLLGGRLDYVGGRTVAVLVYGRRQHKIDAFVWPSPGDSEMKSTASHGYTTISWSGGGMAWSVVSDLNGRELRQCADLLRRASAPN